MRTLPAHKTVVVTGAGSERGIGRAIARRMARRREWDVAVLDIDAASARVVAEEVRDEFGVKALGLGVDIADEAAVQDAIDEIDAKLAPVLGLANLAGVTSPTPFLDTTLDEWNHVFAVNVAGQFLVTRRVLPTMIEHGIGRIVSVSSVSAQRGGGTYGKVAYSASKAAVIGMSRALAREVGEHGITVNTVSPGPIDTDIMGGPISDERAAELIAGLVVDRIGTPDDVAALFEFLLGNDSGFITGATYNINGGLIID